MVVSATEKQPALKPVQLIAREASAEVPTQESGSINKRLLDLQTSYTQINNLLMRNLAVAYVTIGGKNISVVCVRLIDQEMAEYQLDDDSLVEGSAMLRVKHGMVPLKLYIGIPKEGSFLL